MLHADVTLTEDDIPGASLNEPKENHSSYCDKIPEITQGALV